jgi:hypothetical protein
VVSTTVYTQLCVSRQTLPRSEMNVYSDSNVSQKKNNQFSWTQGWQIPLLGIALADLDLAFGNSANKKLVTDIISYNSDNNFVYDQYIDDQSAFSR